MAYFVRGEAGMAQAGTRWVGAAAGLVLGQVLGRALSAAFTTAAGERWLERVDGADLTPFEYRSLAAKWGTNIGKAVSGALGSLFIFGGPPEGQQGLAGQFGIVTEHQMAGPTKRHINYVQLMQRIAEIMLAIGAICKVVGEYLEDRQRTAAESERAAAKRLA
jgi:hypothetical protein